MTDFAVWAPRADRVDLSTRMRTVPMHRGPEGWWHVEEADLAALRSSAEGTDIDYGYLIDGADTVLPDPRSRRQPDGVHERSRTYDPDAYRWGDAGWTGRPLAGGMIYELHVGTFTPEGTFAAAAERLDHLASLGVDFVELLPLNGFNGRHNWGYDGVLWYTVHEQYGGPEAYQAFVDACHRHGIGVIQDVVYNHLGPSGNYLPEFGPYLNDASANTWGSSVNLDGDGSNQVRRYIIDNALMWLGDYNVDGLRLDAVHALADHTATHILEELAQEVDVLAAHVGRPLTLIAESDLNDPRLITSREAHGYGLTAQWSDDFHHAMHVNLTGETTGYYEDFASVGALAKVLTRGFFHDGTYSSFRGRRHGRPVDTALMPTSRFVVCTQNHDQIGNRAIGDRLTASLDEHALGIAAVFTLLGPFTPMLFMGEEWAASTPWQFFTSHPEPELAEATAAGRIEEFARMGWDPSVVPDPQDPDTFRRSHLDWSEADEGRHARMLALYRTLGELRRSHPDFTDPRFERIHVVFDDDGRWLRMRRGRTLIAAHFGEGDVLTPWEGDLQSLVTIGDVEIGAEGIRLGTHSCVVGLV